MELMNYIKYIKLFLDILLLPSILLHELSHWIMCKILNIHVTKVCLLDTNINNPDLASVEYEYDDDNEPLYKQILISLAPLIYLPLFVYFWFNPFNHAYTVKFDMFVYVYIMICVLSAFLPSSTDIRLIFMAYRHKKNMEK